jgi:hypothetical protein
MGEKCFAAEEGGASVKRWEWYEQVPVVALNSTSTTTPTPPRGYEECGAVPCALREAARQV